MSDSLLSNLLLPATLAIITFGLGLSITIQDIRNIVLQPRNVIIGLLSQMILLPVIAFLIAWATKLEPEYSVGLIIISVCPGGATSNLVNYMLRGNVALSLSITIVHGLITTIKIPIVTGLALVVFMKQHAYIQMPYGHAVLQIFLLTIIPAALGIMIRHLKQKIADQLDHPLRIILPALLLTVYAGVIFIEKGEGGASGRDPGSFLYLVPYTLGLNILSMFSGYYIARSLGVAKRNSFTIAVEVGLQNSALAIFVAGTLLHSYAMALVAVVYGSFSFFTTWMFGYIAKKHLQ